MSGSGTDGPSLVLASASPRRRELLERVGLTALVAPAEVDESALPGEDAEAYVTRVAAMKAAAVSARCADAVVLGADTAVVLDGQPLGKPSDRDEALVMLTRLSGRTHVVLTAVSVVAPDGRAHGELCAARVTMAVSSRAELEWYVDTREPFDKAGGYGVQGIGAVLVERLDGDPTTVIGLPLRTSIQLLRAAGLSWPSRPRPA